MSLQGLANSPVVGPVLKEKLSMLPGMKAGRVNEMIKMDCAKVVDTVDIEDMGDKGVFCRCALDTFLILCLKLIISPLGVGSLRSFLIVMGPMPSIIMRLEITWDH